MEHYSPKGKYLWDVWFIKENGQYHMFHLQAPLSMNTKKDREANSSIGHAVSKDMMTWKELPTSLKSSKKGWDNLSLWTGSLIKKGDKFYLFYTGRSRKRSKIQRIGLAVSDDLISWEKHGENPILEADNDIYLMNNRINRLKNPPAWRDPCVFEDPRTGRYIMIISARLKGKSEYNGCLALAESKNLIDWKIKKPLLAPDVYDELETPQMVFHNGYYYIFFSTSWRNYKPVWARKHGAFSGLHCFFSKKLNGDYKPVNGNGVVLDHKETMYDVSLVDNTRGNEFLALGWLFNDNEDKFIGKLGHPLTIFIEKERVFAE